MPKSKKQLKSAVIGCGGIAEGKHLPASSTVPEVAFTSFCDIIPERAAKCAAKYGAEGARTYLNYKELLEKEKPDAVHVLTPNISHAEITIAALEAGAHVICEKPMAKTAADAKRMCETAKKTGKLLTIGYQNRYSPASLYLKKMCARGDLGEIYFAKAHAVRRRAVPTWGVFLDEEKQGGGPLIDIGTHALDLTLYMMDNYKPKSVTGTTYKKLGGLRESGNAWGDWDVDKFTVEDSAFGFITMEDGATIILESSWALNTLEVRESCCSLCGTKAGADTTDGLRINYSDMGKLVTLKPELASGGVAFYEGASNKPEDIEAHIFYSAIQNGTPLTVLPEQALVVSQLLEAIYESARTGKPYVF